MAENPFTEISGWGNFPRSENRLVELKDRKAAGQYTAENSVIARGLGRSYADQAMNDGGLVLDCTGIHKFLAFDEKSGILECEAGTSLKEIIEYLGPRGFFPMITPGTKYVTVGGAIANDVHGKAHHIDGSFINCLQSFTILLANGKTVRASRKENKDLFAATCGGLGLTGIILTAEIRLRKTETAYFRQKSYPVRNLEEMFDAMADADENYTGWVAWVDPLARGDRLGRGVLTAGNHAALDELPRKLRKEPLKISSEGKLNVPFYLPSFSLNGATVRVLNRMIEYVQSHAPEFTHYEKFYYPLDAVLNWNRGYGRRGFTQYQFVIPPADGKKNLRRIMTEISASGCIPFLNVLKKFGPGQKYLSFPMEGYTLAVDFPVTKRLFTFLKRLDKIVTDCGGRIYAGKDATCDAATFEKMYPELKAWKKIKKKYDPHGKFSSNTGRRLGLLTS